MVALRGAVCQAGKLLAKISKNRWYNAMDADHGVRDRIWCNGKQEMWISSYPLAVVH